MTAETTILKLDDGSEVDPSAPGVRAVPVPGERWPRYEINGRRYRVVSENRFPFIPTTGGPVRLLELEPEGPPPN